MPKLFTMMFQQLAIVFLILASLPLAVTLLWKLRLLPLALYFAATDLFFPNWAASHKGLCLGLLIASILFAILAWAFRIYRWKQEQRYYEDLVLARARERYRVTEDGRYVLISDEE